MNPTPQQEQEIERAWEARCREMYLDPLGNVMAERLHFRAGALSQIARVEELKAQVVALREAMLSVLCDPEGKCCISGSNGDRKVIDDALALTAESFAGKCVVDADRLKEIQFALQCVVDNLVTTTNGAFTTAAFDDTEVTLIRDAALAAKDGKPS